MLDIDGSGTLEAEEIIGVLEKRGQLGTGNKDDVKDVANNGLKIFFEQAQKAIKFVRESIGY